jgi:hypothetical protein
VPVASDKLFFRRRTGSVWASWIEVTAAGTTTVVGLIRLATAAEAIAGSSSAIGVTPAGLAAAVQASTMVSAVDSSGVANTMTVALTPNLGAPTDGMEIGARIGVTNTGATTLNLNGTGAVAVKINGQDPLPGQLVGGRWANFIYSSVAGAWQLIGPAPLPIYDSGLFTFSAGTSNTLTHGLGADPTWIEVWIKNISGVTTQGVPPGDYVLVGAANTANNTGVQVRHSGDGAHLTYTIGSSGLQILNPTTFAANSVTIANFQMVIRALPAPR